MKMRLSPFSLTIVDVPDDPVAAVAILRSPQDSTLLIRRSERDSDPWSGHWSFPGGRREPQDADPLCTALRELQEECGIRLSRERLETALPLALARRRVGPYLWVAPFVFRVDAELAPVLDHSEAVAADWVSLSMLRDHRRHSLRRIPGIPAERLYPAVELEGMPLWGFTYRLLSDWLGLSPGQAGFNAHREVLSFLLSHGLALAQDWTDREARVRGVIPVAAVVEHFSPPGRHMAGINCLELRPDSIRVAGPEYEKYVIYAS